MDINAAWKVTASVQGQSLIDALVASLKSAGTNATVSTKQIDALGTILKTTAGDAKLTDAQISALTESIKTVSPAARLSSRELSDLDARIKAAGVSAGLTPKQLDVLSAGIRKVGASADISAAQTTQAFRQLPVQLTDVVTQLAGGQSPFLILLQQGGQVKDSFGGIGNTFKALSTVFTPLKLGIFGVAAALGTLAVAAVQGQNESAKLNNSLQLTGNFAGQTLGKINALAQATAKMSGLSIGESRELVSGAIAGGAFGADVFEPAIEAMARVQRLSGQTAEQTNKDFASMSRGVASWAAEHNRQYNFLTLAEYRQIKAMEESGQKVEAQRLLFDALNRKFKDTEKDMGSLERTWDALGKAASFAWDKMLNIGRTISFEDQITDVQEKLDRARMAFELKGRSYKAPTADTDPEVVRLLAEKNRLEKLLKERNAAVSDASKNLAAEQAAIELEASGERSRISEASAQLSLQRLKNNSDERIALMQNELAKLDGMKNAGLISDSDYAGKKLAIEKRILAERSSLVEEEIKLERSREAKGRPDQINQQVKIEALRGELRQLDAQRTQAEIVGSFGTLDGTFKTAIDGFKETTARADFQTEAIKRLGVATKAATLAQAEYDVVKGKFKNLSSSEKSEILKEAEAEARALDSLRAAQASVEFTKQTRQIEAQTRALGETNLQKQIGVALQDLENRGIEKGSELYKTLAAERIRALEQANAAQNTFNIGARTAFQEYIDNAGNAAKGAQTLFSNAFKGLEDAIVKFAQTGKFSFKEFANALIADIIRIQVRMAIAGLAQSVLSAFSPGAGASSGAGLSAGATAAGNANLSGLGQFGGLFADGAAFSGGKVTAFASGGAFTNNVVSQPTLAPMALFGEAGPEAIMPLTRDSAGRLGVRSAGGGGGGDSIVNIQINTQTGEQQSDGEAGNLKKFGNLIAAGVRQQIINEKRPGGLLAGA